MSDPLSTTADIVTILNDLVKKIRELQRSDSARASLEMRDGRKKVAVVLDISLQKFQVWVKTWVKNASNPEISVEQLWGKEGWTDIQNLLGAIRENAKEIGDDLSKKDDNISHIGWRQTLRTSLNRKNRALRVKRRPLIDSAMLLSGSIDELWTYSEVAFDSLHGMLSYHIEVPLRKRLLARALNERTASLALYEACNQSKADYSLKVDLLDENSGTSPTFRRRSSVSSTVPSVLFYHLFAQNRGNSTMTNNITLGSIPRPSEQDFANADAVKFEIPSSDLAVYESWPTPKSRSGLISIHPHLANAPSYFRVSKRPVVLNWDDKSESLADLLSRDRIEERPLSQEARIEIAFKMVECGLYLLGTPWLASLSSKRLRRLKNSVGNPFVLEVQTLDLEDLYFENPDALSEHSQLFSIGVLLVKIALSEKEDPQDIRDPDSRKSKILPLVEKSMGSLYCGATAFCLMDRRSAPQSGRPEKYKYPEETMWRSYLAELLVDYHAQVFSRWAHELVKLYQRSADTSSGWKKYTT